MLEGIEGVDDAVNALTEYGTVEEGANARIKELESSLAEANSKYEATAARNYELMLGATDKVDDSDATEDETDDFDDETIIDSMIKED